MSEQSAWPLCSWLSRQGAPTLAKPSSPKATRAAQGHKGVPGQDTQGLCYLPPTHPSLTPLDMQKSAWPDQPPQKWSPLGKDELAMRLGSLMEREKTSWQCFKVRAGRGCGGQCPQVYKIFQGPGASFLRTGPCCPLSHTHLVYLPSSSRHSAGQLTGPQGASFILNSQNDTPPQVMPITQGIHMPVAWSLPSHEPLTMDHVSPSRLASLSLCTNSECCEDGPSLFLWILTQKHENERKTAYACSVLKDFLCHQSLWLRRTVTFSWD